MAQPHSAAAARLLAAALLVGVSACDQITGSDSSPDEIRISEPTLSLTSGSTRQLEATVLDGDDDELDAAGWQVVWSSADTAIATVVNGLVTAKKVGEVSITASLGDIEGSSRLTVTPGPIAGFRITPDSLFLTDSQLTTRLTAAPRDAYGNVIQSQQAVTWSSSDTAIAQVSSDGTVSARYTGVATITAKAGDAAATAKVWIIRNARIGASLPADTAYTTVTPSFPVEVDLSFKEVASATVSIDGGAEKNLRAEGQTGTGRYLFRFHAGAVNGLSVVPALGPGTHTLRFRARDTGGTLLAERSIVVRIDIPVRRYSVRVLPTLGGDGGRGYEINERGQVVGWAKRPTGTQRAAFWDGSEVRDLGEGYHGSSEAIGINESGEVVGAFRYNCCQSTPAGSFYWSPGMPAPTILATEAFDVNDSGAMLVRRSNAWFLSIDGEEHSFRDPVFGVTTLNNRNESVNFGSIVSIDRDPVRMVEGTQAQITDLNDRGDIVFTDEAIGGYRLGVSSPIVRFDAVAPAIRPAAINNRGVVAGTLHNSFGRFFPPTWSALFVADEGVVYAIELTSQVAIATIADINDAGVILANTAGSNGRAVVLTPVP